MYDAFGLLNLNADVMSNYALQAREIGNDYEAVRILDRSNHRLREIAGKMQSDGKRPDFGKQSVNAVIEKFMRNLEIGFEAWTPRELRVLSYYLGSIPASQQAFEYALSLLESNWRDLFINGLVFYLMNYWNTCPKSNRCNVCEMLKRHLGGYKGKVKRYVQLRNMSDIFDDAGPIRLSSLLIAKKLPVEDAPIPLGFKRSALPFPFFSDVIVNFVKRTSLYDFDAMESLLSARHSLDRTKKLIYAYMIEDAEKRNDNALQSNVSRSALRVLGDIGLSSTWAPFSGATDVEKELLIKAKELVCAWAARKSVEAFFEICVQDPRRKKCWLKYVLNVSDFRIVGSTSTHTKLLSYPSIAPLLKNNFINTNSRVSATAALVLFIRDKVFVEFSDIGSLYIYNSSRSLVRNIKNKRFVESIADLKAPSIGIAVEKISSWGYEYNEEGRLTHRGDWEDRFSKWMKNKMGISAGQKLNYAAPSSTIELSIF